MKDKIQRRKPASKMLSLAGRPGSEPDTVSQVELREAAELQATVWLAEKQAREAVQRIQFRLDHGARVEPGELVFDGELQMVRTRKTGTK